MKGVTHFVLYLLYIQENCVRAHRGVPDNAYALRTGGVGVKNCQFLAYILYGWPLINVAHVLE